MISVGVLISIAIISALICVITFLIEFTLKKIWDVEEFTGSIWKVLSTSRKILLCVALFSILLAIFIGAIYLISLTFRVGFWIV